MRNILITIMVMLTGTCFSTQQSASQVDGQAGFLLNSINYKVPGLMF